MIPTDQLPAAVTEEIERTLLEVRLARATDLARSARFSEAEAILSPDDTLPHNAREIDLLARIAFHQGKLRRARRLWEAALQTDPQNPAYRECLAKLPLIKIPPDRALTWLIWVTNILGIATLLYVFLARK